MGDKDPIDELRELNDSIAALEHPPAYHLEFDLWNQNALEVLRRHFGESSAAAFENAWHTETAMEAAEEYTLFLKTLELKKKALAAIIADCQQALLDKKKAEEAAKAKQLREARLQAAQRAFPSKGDPVRSPELDQCVILVPLSADPRKTAEYEERFRLAIQPAVQTTGLKPVLDIIGRMPKRFQDNVQLLRTCELAVVDLTDWSSDCIWMLGVLNAWDVPVVLLQPKGDPLPAGACAEMVVHYSGKTPADQDALRQLLRGKLKDVLGHPESGKSLPRLQGQADAIDLFESGK